MHFLHISDKLWRYVWKPQAGTKFAHGRFFRSGALICLSFGLFDYIYSSLSFIRLQLFYPSQRRPSSQSASVTLLQDVHIELWPRIQACPKLSHDLKWQINKQQITCQTPAGKMLRVSSYQRTAGKGNEKGHFHLTRNHYLTTPCLFSPPGESVNIITYHLCLDVMQIVSDTWAVIGSVLYGTNKFSVQLN